MPKPRGLRGGLIGCGYFSKHHLLAWARTPAQIVAACDLDLSRAQAAAPAAYPTAAEMLERERLDFVDIATRPDTHRDLIDLALRHRVAIVCQKPLAPNWEDVLAIAAAVREADTPFMVHVNWRWQAWHREIARRIGAGDIGRPIAYAFRTRGEDGLGKDAYARQPYFRDMGRFLIYELLVHYLDTARFLFGPVSSVFAQATRRNARIAGEDRAVILVQHRESVDGVVDGHRFLALGDSDQALGDAWFEGEEGRIVLDASGDLSLNGELVWRNPRKGYRGDSVFNAFSHFLDCLAERKPFETGVEDHIQTVAAMEACYRSIAERRAVYPEEMFQRPG